MLDQLVADWARRHPPNPAGDLNTGGQYCGRFAPSPTGPLHAGSLVAALASWLDARTHGGRWLLRIDDLDAPRTVPGASAHILAALKAHGLAWDGEVVYQSQRHAAYRDAFERLRAAGWVYACGCTRKEIADSLTHVAGSTALGARGRESIYPGTCRGGLAQGLTQGRTPRAWRVRVGDASVAFTDFSGGTIKHDLARDTGDFVLLRADGQWAYQIAVVVDDADAGVTHVVRGADLLNSTPRQIFLQQRLGVPTPSYRHIPVVASANGEKLSKQNGAQALVLDVRSVALALEQAARHLFG